MAGRLQLVTADLARATGSATPGGSFWIVVHCVSPYECTRVCACACACACVVGGVGVRVSVCACVGVKDVRLKYLSNVNRWDGTV